MQRGDAVPHFRVTTVAGETVDYASIWQRNQLVLIALGGDGSDYAEQATRALAGQRDTTLVITRDSIDGLRPAAVVIADRWGEVVHVDHAAAARDLPPVSELLDWIEHLRQRCPECEGESR